MCYVETVYHLVRVSGRTIFDLDARLGRSTVSTCGIGEGRDPGEMKASVHVVTTVYHVRGVGRPSGVITASERSLMRGSRYGLELKVDIPEREFL